MIRNDLFLMISAFPHNFLSLFTSSPSFLPSLPLSILSPLWLTVLAAGSKPAVHLTSNVLYHSPLSRLSDLAAALMHRHARLSSRHIIHLSLALSRKPTSTWPMKRSGSEMIQHPFYPSTPCNVIEVAGTANESISISSCCFALLVPGFDVKWWSDHTRLKIPVNIKLRVIK